MSIKSDIQDACLSFTLSVIDGLEPASNARVKTTLGEGTFSIPAEAVWPCELDGSLHAESVKLSTVVGPLIERKDRGKHQLYFVDPFHEPVINMTDVDTQQLSSSAIFTLYKIRQDFDRVSDEIIDVAFSKCRSFNAFCIVSVHDLLSITIDSRTPFSDIIDHSNLILVQAFDGMDFIRWESVRG